MSRRKRPPELPEPVAPVPPSKQQHGSLRRTARQWDSQIMARWWRQRDNTAKRKERE